MANTKEVTFSPREMEVLALAWQFMETQPKIDMVKLAALTGYTPGSASVTLGKIKQKIKMVGGDSASASTTAGAVGGDAGPGMPTPRKRKAKAPVEKKIPRKSAKKGSPVGGSSPTPASLFKEENDEEFDMITVKKEEPIF